MQTAIANLLPSKEAKAFKTLFKLYENKEYKRGIRQANEILERVPDHPETNSLKGLFLYNTGEQEKGLELAKAALAKNFKSELCWHILGILNRSQRKYAEAIGCYKNALKYDPENLNILRDLAVLQVHIRELDSHQETRLHLLKNKSNLPLNWIALAVSQHLLGNYPETLKVLESFWNVIRAEDLKPYEKSEIYLYEVMVLLETKDYKAVIQRLNKYDKFIVDRTAFNEFIAKAHSGLGEPEKAEPYVRNLFDTYPENLKIVQLWQEVRGLTPATSENRQKNVDLHNEILKDFPTSQVVKRNLLKYLVGDEFRQKFDEYLRPFFIKGLPSVFNDVKEFLEDAEKAKIIEELALNHLKSLEQKSTFFGSDVEESPCCLLWSYLFLAELFSWKGEFTQAHDYVEKAIAHTPTLVELYIIKAKIYKKSYNYKLASEAADKARLMDLADRYPNNLTVKYRVRNNELAESENLLKLFRDSTDTDLHELQYMWYEYEVGSTHLRNKEFGPGFRQFKFIEKHFQDFYEDQFDFHTYCLRKYDLRAYVNLLRKEDDIYNNKWYSKATVTMINALQAYEEALPTIKQQEIQKEEEEKKMLEEMDKHERKRYKAEKEAKEKETDPAKEKLDLKGKKVLEEIKNPLDEACKFASKILSCNIEKKKERVVVFTHICLLFLKKGKPLVALKAYNKIANLANEDGDVHVTRLRLVQELERVLTSDTLNADLKPIIEDELKAIKGDSDLKKLQETFKSSAKSLYSQVKGVEGDYLLGAFQKDGAVKAIEDLITKNKDSARIKEVVEALNQARTLYGASEEAVKKIQGLFKDRFKFSPLFNEEAVNLKAISEIAIPILS